MGRNLDTAGAAAQEKAIANYMSKAKLPVDNRDKSTRKILNWSWLRVETHWGFHFDERETVIEVRLPWKLRWRGGPWTRAVNRSYVIVFGRVHTRLTNGAWHARGGPSTWNRDIW